MRPVVHCIWHRLIKLGAIASGLALVSLVTPAPAQELSTQAPGVERRAELRYLLSQDCGSCHGLTLAGGLGPALTRDALRGKPNELLLNTILKGRPGTAMPPWEGLLTKAEAGYLVDLLTESQP